MRFKRIFRRNSSKLILFVLLCTSSAAIGLQTPVQVFAASSVDSSKMVEVLRTAKIFQADMRVITTYDKQNSRAIVVVDRTRNETDKDCKINAVLAAKELMNIYPNEVTSVRVVYKSASGDAEIAGKQVDVSKVAVKAFGSGVVKADELLESLSMVDATSELNADTVAGAALSVVDGAHQEQRLSLLTRIEALKKRGTGVAAYEKLFQAIEHEAQSSQESQLTTDIQSLSEHLTEQERMVKQAAAVEKEHDTHQEQAQGGRYTPNVRKNRLEKRLEYARSNQAAVERAGHGKKFHKLLSSSQQQIDSGDLNSAWQSCLQIDLVLRDVGLAPSASLFPRPKD